MRSTMQQLVHNTAGQGTGKNRAPAADIIRAMIMNNDRANCSSLTPYLQKLGAYLDEYAKFDRGDAMQYETSWKSALQQSAPESGSGLDTVIEELGQVVIANGSQVPNPGFTSFITTGATNAGILANLAAQVAAPQRNFLHAFNFLEELSLQWLAQMFCLAPDMKGVYSSGGSVANLVALGAARQSAFEKRAIDPAKQGIRLGARIYASSASHRTIQRAAAVLGLGRDAVCIIDSDIQGRMIAERLQQQLILDRDSDRIPLAIVANAGSTATGAIDSLDRLGAIAKQHDIWLHVDGAYGLPGILDPRVKSLYQGLELADSVIVDPHKWLGAPIGIGATFVRDRNILHRAFTQGASDYLEGSFSQSNAEHELDSMGIPYYDFGVELSAPSRGVVVWALIREIGVEGMRQRICRHNDLAQRLAQLVEQHPHLELLQTPTLSICCFRYVDDQCTDLNKLNSQIHRQLVRNNNNIPSTVIVNGQLGIRPCFIGARTGEQQVDALYQEVLQLGEQIMQDFKLNKNESKGSHHG